MSLDMSSYADSTEINFQSEEVAETDALWVENVIATAVTAFMVLCASSMAVVMYLA